MRQERADSLAAGATLLHNGGTELATAKTVGMIWGLDALLALSYEDWGSDDA